MTAAPAAAPRGGAARVGAARFAERSRASRSSGGAAAADGAARVEPRHSAYSHDSKSVLLRGSDATHLTPRVSESPAGSQRVGSATARPSWSSSSSLLGGRLSAGSAASPGSPARARVGRRRHVVAGVGRRGGRGARLVDKGATSPARSSAPARWARWARPGAPALSPQYAAAAARRVSAVAAREDVAAEEGDEPPPGDSFGSPAGLAVANLRVVGGRGSQPPPVGRPRSAISRLSPP